MLHKIEIPNETLPAFKEALEANKTTVTESWDTEGRRHFVLDLKFANELFYLGTSYGINALSKSVTEKHDPILSN